MDHRIHSTYGPAASAPSEAATRSRLIIHTYDELIAALEQEEPERARMILDGLSRSLAFDAMPGLAAGLASLYAGFTARLSVVGGLPEVLQAVRHLRTVWMHAAKISEKSLNGD